MIRLHADHVLAWAGTDHALLRDGEVEVDGGRIVRVGPRTTAQPAPGTRTVELGSALLMPGLIDLDALADIDHALLDSFGGPQHARDLTWSLRYLEQGPRDVFTREEKAFVRRYAFVQLLLHGVTTAMPIAAETHSRWAETYDEAVDMAREARALGLRCYLGPSYRSGVGAVRADGSATVWWDEEAGRTGLADAVRFARWLREEHDALLRPVLLPCRVETMSDDLLAATAEAARSLDVKVRLHCLQGVAERHRLAEQGRGDPLSVLERAGLLGDRLLVPHGIHLDAHSSVGAGTDRDLARLVENRVSVVHCPLTSARYGSAMETFARYRAAGLNIALGTDSFPPDLVRGMDFGVNLAKVQSGRTDTVTPADYVRAATVAGAAALGREDLGRIAPGAQADLVAFALDDVRDGVLDDPVRTLLSNGTGRAVRMSMIAGRVVVRDGRVPGVRTGPLRARAQELFDRMRSAYAGRDRLGRPPDRLFPPSFPLA
ncbi:putative amidohydrolase [Actinacidiphila reveromycinica]|uniref:Putative amidohydrolase n=1 Tax=Actinacidiphila reveromycinica TaxID=659352 RepID=A0A7U3V0V1_9ACTN|nr:chlorohydrolase family protein [Streptomyces sp. SN-593]BBB02308.1 putative amidohydrolase [Streptomyces sp. SN-593]